jgi:hypothetical protein
MKLLSRIVEKDLGFFSFLSVFSYAERFSQLQPTDYGMASKPVLRLRQAYWL